MTAFRFRMQRVLRVRELEERAAFARWVEATGAVERAERIAQGIAHQRALEQSGLADRLATASIRPREVLAAQGLLDGLADAQWKAGERVKSLAYQAALLRTPWEELRRARRGLELLREKHAAEHALEDERQDSLLMDEVASQRESRRLSNSDMELRHSMDARQ